MAYVTPIVTRLDICHFADTGGGDVGLVGGKGLSLGLMASAGLPVPPGFCLTTEAYRRWAADDGTIALDEGLRSRLIEAYRELGGGAVAVRSSATYEDAAGASFAGQQETILGVEGDARLAEAVVRCFQSLHTARALAYRSAHKIDDRDAAMAVVVQRLVDAEVAGVLFTRDPLDPEGRRMLVEAAPGLGELVVSGRVTPDRFHADRDSGQVLDQEIHEQDVMATRGGLVPVDPARRALACLSEEQLERLVALGRQVEEFFGEPRDVEWAFAAGQFWLLQARPITTASAAEREQLRREEIVALQARAELRGTVWARYNLAEVLPEPTPMTWAIVRAFMSGRGGFGLMYRDLGFDPDPALDEEGFFDLVCGRPYVNLSREPKLYFRDFPYGHGFAALKAEPAEAMYPAPAADRARMSAQFWLRLPAIVFRMLRCQSRMRRLAATQADRLRNDIFPRFAAETAEEQKRGFAGLSPAELVERIEHWRRRTLLDFARESLRPSMFAAAALAELGKGLAQFLPAQRAAQEARAQMGGVRPAPEEDLPGALAALNAGRLARDEFLARFGHRGPGEMELSLPRWSETPDQIPLKPGGDRKSDAIAAEPTGDPQHDAWERLLREANVGAGQHKSLSATRHSARTYLALRESAKHYLMMGYALIRAALVEWDRRFDLNGDVFYLLPEELPRLANGDDLRALAAVRKKRRRTALALPVPPVIFSDDLEAIGKAQPVQASAELKGTPVSAGVAEGQALVLTDPAAAPEDALGFILVCPSTDPAWVPLFLRARGLVMETGGVLSHGAIVAREFSLPAVAGIADACRRLQTGQRLRVDGTSGAVHVLV